MTSFYQWLLGELFHHNLNKPMGTPPSVVWLEKWAKATWHGTSFETHLYYVCHGWKAGYVCMLQMWEWILKLCSIQFIYMTSPGYESLAYGCPNVQINTHNIITFISAYKCLFLWMAEVVYSLSPLVVIVLSCQCFVFLCHSGLHCGGMVIIWNDFCVFSDFLPKINICKNGTHWLPDVAWKENDW